MSYFSVEKSESAIIMDQFPSPPSHVRHIAGPTADQIADLLLEKVNMEVLKGYDNLDLTQAGQQKLDEMIGQLGVCRGPQEIIPMVCIFVCILRLKLMDWVCSAMRSSDMRFRRHLRILSLIRSALYYHLAYPEP
jgi:hypothetical protein